MRRGRRTVPPSMSGTPQRLQKMPKTASASITRRSHHSANSMPPATACPATAAMTGLDSTILLGPIGPAPSGCTRLPSAEPNALRSAPEQNVPPAPHRTATRWTPSASNDSKAETSAAAVGPSTALRRAGRSRTTVVTGPAISTRTVMALPIPQRARGLGAHLLHGARLLVGVALLRPRIGAHVIAVLLPEPRGIDVEELEGAQPFRALPEVELRQHEAQRTAVVGLEVAAVMLEREQHIAVHEVGQARVRRIVGIRMLQDEFRLGQHLHPT